MTQIALESLLRVSVVERARRIQSESGGRLDLIAAKLGLISDAELAILYATHLGEPVLPVSRYPASAVAADRLRPNYFRRARLLPVEEQEGACLIAMADPLDDEAAAAVAFVLEKAVVQLAKL